LLLVVASSFLAAFWSHFHWKLPFWSSSQNIGQEQGVEEYDYIIVGAGPAGLVVAFHLAKRLQQESIKAYGTNDHAGKVLVLESGRESQSDVMKLLLHDTSSHGFAKDARDGNHYSQQQDKSSWIFVGGGLNKFDVPFLWSELSSRDDWSEYLSHHWPVDQTFLGRAVGGSGIHNAM
jgi:choline dehydrogenase-like flavoprotein